MYVYRFQTRTMRVRCKSYKSKSNCRVNFLKEKTEEKRKRLKIRKLLFRNIRKRDISIPRKRNLIATKSALFKGL